MKDNEIPTDADDVPALPERLREDLARLDGPPVQVPRALEIDILASAKAAFGRRMRFRAIARWTVAAAAFAAVAFGVHIGLNNRAQRLATENPRPAASPPPSRDFSLIRPRIPGDIDGDGKVDMLDAYILAKRLSSGAKRDPAWDVNRDGVVDQLDVDWIVNSSVSLDTASAALGGMAQ